jgi:predicted metal-dependent hydrolase
MSSKALEWAVKLSVNPRVVCVQAMRHKWGSCSSKGTVTLALDLGDVW